MRPTDLYRPSLSLLTDLYQLTMGQAYFSAGLAEREATFHLFFRKAPFNGGYSLACGLGDAVDILTHLRFTAEDLEYLATLPGRDGRPLFTRAYLEYLGGLCFTCDLEGIPEGTVVFPHEPLLRLTGPTLQAQLVETILLDILNFQTLIATKSARVCEAAQGASVLEFGLRRAQGIDGALSASRAAYIGGCSATSNVLAGKLYGIPVRGTHAHSWVMAFEEELTAFRKYAEAMPNNCVFLVDTYDTLEGVRHAVEVGKELRAQGHELGGIRLDSGDLAYLAKCARKILDEGGFPKAQIVASNDLDEHLIEALRHQGAPIDVWGVGTKLVTAYDQPALGGVYKLGAIRDESGIWQHRIKLSEHPIKVSNPGRLQVRRFHDGKLFRGDVIWDELLPEPAAYSLVDPADPLRSRQIPKEWASEDLLVPVLSKGQPVGELPTLEQTRERARAQLRQLHEGTRRIPNPHEYPVGLESSLHALKTRLICEARQA